MLNCDILKESRKLKIDLLNVATLLNVAYT